MTEITKPIAVSIYDHDENLSLRPAIVQTVDGKQYAVDHLQRRQSFLRLINFETEACDEVREVVDFPHHRVKAIQRYPLLKAQIELLQEEEHYAAPNTRDTEPEILTEGDSR